MAEHVKRQWFLCGRTSSRQGIASDEKFRLINLVFPIASLVFAFSLFLHTDAGSQDKAPVADQLIGGKFSYFAQRGDSLTGIGARFGVGVGVLAADNDLSPSSLLRTGQQLRVDNRHIVPNIVRDGIVINIPQRMLFYFKEGRLIRSFPVGLGRHDWPTPTGPFKIVTKEENPIWEVPVSIQEEMQREGKTVKTCVPAGPDNPLGKHWLGLSIAGYGIHGTIAPTSIYQFQTHGCIRVHPDDIAGLFDEVSRGTPGILVYRRLMIANVGGNVYLEVHRDVYRKDVDVHVQFEELLKSLPDIRVDRELAASIIRKQEGIAREIGVENSR
ncbi:MAG TPA: L,D-transpeptidase family protein [Candidatus Binatia bacterium]|jgi:L,D-transpeptidase ErfK/SrfK